MHGKNAQLALDTINRKSASGIPTWLIHTMEHRLIERLANASSGDYRQNPGEVYLKAQKSAGVCMIDQYIPDNPLDMGEHGYEGHEHGATTGASSIIADGIAIDSPESVVKHMEQIVFPMLRNEIENPPDENEICQRIINEERSVQESFGDDILKVPYGIARFPYLDYYRYGYEHFFTAWVIYPEVMERCFSLMADTAIHYNKAVVRAYIEGGLPPLLRADHDLADSRGIIAGMKSLEKLWLPHFTRAMKPLIDAGIKVIWHCDGNLMELIPRLLDIGLSGFQGFQYETGMDYGKICRMRTKNGDELIIIAGVSVTRTLPFGTPHEIRHEVKWLVENGPETGLFLGCSSSVTPGVPWENIEALTESLSWYREHGRE